MNFGEIWAFMLWGGGEESREPVQLPRARRAPSPVAAAMPVGGTRRGCWRGLGLGLAASSCCLHGEG